MLSIGGNNNANPRFNNEVQARKWLTANGFTCTRSGATALYFNGDKYVYASANDYRFDRAGGRIGLLIEAPQENLALRSADGNNATWTNGNSTKATATSIISGETATKITASSTNGNIAQIVGTFTGNEETYCAIIEQGTSTTSAIWMRDTTAASTVCAVTLTWSTGGTAVTAGSANSYGAELIKSSGPNGGAVYLVWMRYSGTGTNARQVRVVSDDTDGTKYCYFHVANLSEDSVVGSPIITTTASVTRNADYIKSTSLGTLWGPSATTVSAHYGTINPPAASGEYFGVIAFSEGVGAEAAFIGTINVSGTSYGIASHTSSSSTNNAVTSATTFDSSIKSSGAFNNADVHCGNDGNTGTSAGPSAYPAVTQIELGNILNVAAYYMNGKIYSLRFQRAMTSQADQAGLSS